MKIVCVVPAWNEEKNIGAVVASVKKWVEDVIVVDDGSKDQTAKVALANGALVLKHPINRGQGAALRTGTQYALENGAEVIVHFDADGQFLADEILEAAQSVIAGEVEAVFGSRFLDKEHNLPPLKKRLILPLARIFNRFFLGVKFDDPQNGFRILSAKAAQKLDWRQDKMAHCSEILWLTKKNKINYKEVGVTVRYSEFGQRMSGGLRIIKDLFLDKLIK